MELINLEGEELADFAKVLKLFRSQIENDENGIPKQHIANPDQKRKRSQFKL